MNPIDWHARYRQQASWTRELRAYLFGRCGWRPAQYVLETGCGTGAVLADFPPGAGITGLDIDAGRLEQAGDHAPHAHLILGDALSLPIASHSFEISFCHFLLLWVPDPLSALREMIRVTRHGGFVLALAEPDYTRRYDSPSELAELGHLQAESLRRQGADPEIGARLAGLFQQAGLEIVETGTLESNRSLLFDPAGFETEWSVMEADLDGMLPVAELRRLKQLDRVSWGAGKRVMHVPTHYAMGRIKSS